MLAIIIIAMVMAWFALKFILRSEYVRNSVLTSKGV